MRKTATAASETTAATTSESATHTTSKAPAALSDSGT
jgi:hypothetical protein